MGADHVLEVDSARRLLHELRKGSRDPLIIREPVEAVLADIFHKDLATGDVEA